MFQTDRRQTLFGIVGASAFLAVPGKSLSAGVHSMPNPGDTASVSMRHALLIDASAKHVYDAVTTSEGISGWWTPGAQAKPERNSIAHIPFGPDYFKEMRVVELEPSKHVKWLCVAGVDEWKGTTISFNLEAGNRDAFLTSHPELKDQITQQTKADPQTLLTLSHDGWKYTPMFAECNYTWGQFLRSLKLFCETGTGRPWPNQHRA